MPDNLETRLAAALSSLVDDVTAAPDLAENARAVAHRTRQLRLAASLAATLALVLGLLLHGVVASRETVPADHAGGPLTCTHPASRVVTAADADRRGLFPSSASDVAVAVVVCPTGGPAGSSGRTGWDLPTRAITSKDALAYVNVSGAADRQCPAAPPGPMFTVTLEAPTGALTTYRSPDLACDGRVLIGSFSQALAEQDSVVAAAQRAVPECPGLTAPPVAPPATAPHLTRSTVVTSVLVCDHPGLRPAAETIRVQPVIRRDGTAQLAGLLTADLRAGAAGSGNLRTCPGTGDLHEGAITLRLRTADHHQVDLRGTCADQLWVDGTDRQPFVPSVATARAIERLTQP